MIQSVGAKIFVEKKSCLMLKHSRKLAIVVDKILTIVICAIFLLQIISQLLLTLVFTNSFSQELMIVWRIVFNLNRPVLSAHTIG